MEKYKKERAGERLEREREREIHRTFKERERERDGKKRYLWTMDQILKWTF